MGHSNIVEPEASSKALDAVNRYIHTLFDRAPVMMHSEDREGKLIRVNRRWLQRMGYTRDEVLGRRSTEFLTAESRVRAVNDTLPLFWQVGSARSVGYRFLPKNGRMFDILLDAEVSSTSTGPLFAYAVIRKAHDPTQWEQSSTTLQGLMGLTQVRRNLESVTAIGTEAPFPGLPVVQGKPTPTLEAALASEALPALLELTQDISRSLRGLLRVQEEWLGETAEQQSELLLVAKSIGKTLADLGDILPAGPRHPRKPC